MKRSLSKLNGFTGALLIGLSIICGAQWWSAATRSAAHLERAREWETRGQLHRALSHYQWSARAYAPGTPSGELAMERLWALAQAAEQEQPALALEAYDLMRGAVWSTRWLLSPYQSWSEPVDLAIAKLRGPRAAHRLADDPRPHPVRSALLLVSVIALIGSLIWLLRVGLTPQLAFTPEAPRPALLSALSLISLWLSLAF